MLYRPFGKTGTQISAVSFGGMRFAAPADINVSAALIQYAHSKGINYFDTAPAYCGDRSEDIFGTALRGLPRNSFLVSTKCGRASGDELRRSLERSLQRLGVDSIDFFYIWHLMNPADWDSRLRGGAVEAALRAREEGLIGHLLCSSHMEGTALGQVLAEDIFAGVLLGYNVLNFPYRRAAVELAGQHGIGVVTMNPLGGGLIPQNPQRFRFLKTITGDDLVPAALRFNLSHPAISSALVGISTRQDIDMAVAAMEEFSPYNSAQLQQLQDNTREAFSGLCTGCGYCLPCPADIPVPKFMDSYNQLILSGGKHQAVQDRFNMHWRISPELAHRCIACGACEQRCTQHLPIIERLAELPDKTASA